MELAEDRVGIQNKSYAALFTVLCHLPPHMSTVKPLSNPPNRLPTTLPTNITDLADPSSVIPEHYHTAGHQPIQLTHNVLTRLRVGLLLSASPACPLEPGTWSLQ